MLFLETSTAFLAIIPEVLISLVPMAYFTSEWSQSDLKYKFHHARIAEIRVVIHYHFPVKTLNVLRRAKRIFIIWALPGFCFPRTKLGATLVKDLTLGYGWWWIHLQKDTCHIELDWLDFVIWISSPRTSAFSPRKTKLFSALFRRIGIVCYF